MGHTSLKSILTSLLLLGGSFNVIAAPEHRISLGGAIHSYSQIREKLDENVEYEMGPPYFGENPIIGQSIDGFAWRELENFPITVNLHYECSLGSRWGVGICFGYEYQKMSLEISKWTYMGEKTDVPEPYSHYARFTNKYTTTDETGRLDRHIFFIAPEATFYYYKRERVAMYGKVAAGIKFHSLKKTNVEEEIGGETYFEKRPFCFQVSPLCFEFGDKKFRGFMEYGFGHQGLAQFGIRRIFTKKNAE